MSFEKNHTVNLGRKVSEETKKKISEAMKRLLSDKDIRNKLRVEGRMKRKQRLGYVNSPDARIKFSNSLSKMWQEGKATEKQKSTLFKKGYDPKRNIDQTFKEGHEVPADWIEAVKESRKTQVFPKTDTKIEIKVQDFLKQLGITFFTHQYMNIEHGYQCDFFIPSMNLVIECDGNYWHKYPIGNEIDHIRTRELIEKGFKVLRLWEQDIEIMGLDDFKNKLGENQ